MWQRAVLLAALVVVAYGECLFAQTSSTSLNRAILRYAKAYREGDIKTLVSIYDRSSFAAPSDWADLELGLRVERERRGSPEDVRIVRAETLGDKAYVMMSYRWPGADDLEEIQFWAQIHRHWRLTVDRNKALKPDPTVWSQFRMTLQAASSELAPSERERNTLLENSRTVVRALYQGDCSEAMKHVTLFNSVPYGLGWDLEYQSRSLCMNMWRINAGDAAATRGPQSDKASIQWRNDIIQLDLIPMQKDVLGGRSLWCAYVFIPIPIESDLGQGLAIAWIRTPDGWKIWDVSHIGYPFG